MKKRQERERSVDAPMHAPGRYLFTSERLGFRPWSGEELQDLSRINSDPEVMRFFPSIQDIHQTRDFIQRMQALYREKAFCYFATDRLDNGHFIGFIGLAVQNFESDFTPCVDIGWRLDSSEWYKGYASEGAFRCLCYGFEDLGLGRIFCIAPLVNRPSVRVMEKIGMKQVKTFNHPRLADHKILEECVVSEKLKEPASRL